MSFRPINELRTLYSFCIGSDHPEHAASSPMACGTGRTFTMATPRIYGEHAKASAEKGLRATPGPPSLPSLQTGRDAPRGRIPSMPSPPPALWWAEVEATPGRPLD